MPSGANSIASVSPAGPLPTIQRSKAISAPFSISRSASRIMRRVRSIWIGIGDGPSFSAVFGVDTVRIEPGLGFRTPHASDPSRIAVSRRTEDSRNASAATGGNYSTPLFARKPYFGIKSRHKTEIRSHCERNMRSVLLLRYRSRERGNSKFPMISARKTNKFSYRIGSPGRVKSRYSLTVRNRRCNRDLPVRTATQAYPQDQGIDTCWL